MDSINKCVILHRHVRLALPFCEKSRGVGKHASENLVMK